MRAYIVYNLAADVTWNPEDVLLCNDHRINCTSACAITVPAVEPGDGCWVSNIGTATLTFKDGGTTIGTLAAGTSTLLVKLGSGSWRIQLMEPVGGTEP